MNKIIYDQYILINKKLIHRIIESIKPFKNQNFIEIGPGNGSLTNYIIKYINNLTIIEIDYKILSKEILNNKKINIIIGNAKNINFLDLFNINKKKMRIFGNLPYSVSVPIIINFIKYKKYIFDINIMIQKELSDRLLSKHNNKNYCRLTVLIKSFFKIEEIISNIDQNSFFPKPKIFSSFIRLIPINNIKLLNSNLNIKELEFFTKLLFNKRRKIIKNIFPKKIKSKLLQSIDKNYINLRIENLSIYNIYKLINDIKKYYIYC